VVVVMMMMMMMMTEDTVQLKDNGDISDADDSPSPDLDSDGVPDLVVGARGSYDEEQTSRPGGIYVMYMQRSPTTPVRFAWVVWPSLGNSVRGPWWWLWWWMMG
jgi:hypothetical protein